MINGRPRRDAQAFANCMVMLLLAACGGCNGRYIVPDSSSRATVWLVNQTGNMQAFLRAIDDTACEHNEEAGLLAVVGRPSGSKKAVAVEAGQMLAFNLRAKNYDDAERRCQLTFGFVPHVGDQYEIRYYTRDGQCMIDVIRLLPEGSAFSHNSVPVNWSARNCFSAF